MVGKEEQPRCFARTARWAANVKPRGGEESREVSERRLGGQCRCCENSHCRGSAYTRTLVYRMVKTIVLLLLLAVCVAAVAASHVNSEENNLEWYLHMYRDRTCEGDVVHRVRVSSKGDKHCDVADIKIETYQHDRFHLHSQQVLPPPHHSEHGQRMRWYLYSDKECQDFVDNQSLSDKGCWPLPNPVEIDGIQLGSVRVDYEHV